MSAADLSILFTPLDAAGLVLLVIAWLGTTWMIEHPPANRPSTAYLMSRYRREWMRQMVTRQPRIFDAQIVANLRQSTAFFASASMIAIGGGFALIGNADLLRGVASDLTQSNAPVEVWELKLIVMMALTANAFLKFVWSLRLFGYCSVLMAAVPNDETDPVAYARAEKAAEINITAARGYNRGLRLIYFSIASAAWLMGPIPLILAVLVTLVVIGRREFASHSRAVLLNDSDTIM